MSTSSSSAYIALNDALAQSYERENRGIPRLFARYMVKTLLPPITSETHIHDNACGPAIATSEVLSLIRAGSTAPQITCTDISQPMIDTTKALIQKNGWTTVTATVADSQDLRAANIPDNAFDISLVNFSLMMLANPANGAAEIYRTLKPGAVAAITTWKHHGFADLLARISTNIRPEAPLTGVLLQKFPDEERMRGLLRNAGFSAAHIKVEVRHESLGFSGLEDLKDLMTGQIGSFAMRDWTEDERRLVKEEDKVLLDALNDDEKSSGKLDMEAWVITARK